MAYYYNFYIVMIEFKYVDDLAKCTSLKSVFI